MRLVKQGEKSFLRLSRTEWTKLGKMFLEASGIPQIKQRDFTKWLKSKGYVFDRMAGSHQVWINSNPPTVFTNVQGQPAKTVGFAAPTTEKYVHPFQLKKFVSMYMAGVNLNYLLQELNLR